MKLNEVRILTNVSLSETQKIIMARIASAENPHVAFESINEGVNLVSAAKQLANLGLIQMGGGQASVTDKGNGILSDEGLADKTGGLTEEGQKYAEMKGPSEKGHDTEPPQPTDTDAGGNMGMGGLGGDMGMDGDIGMDGEDELGLDNEEGLDDTSEEDPEDEIQLQSFDLLSKIEDGISLEDQINNL